MNHQKLRLTRKSFYSHSQTLLHLIHTLRKRVAVSNKLQSYNASFYIYTIYINHTVEYT